VAALGAPFYKPYHFDSVGDFETYISSPDYNTNGQTKGVCFGMEVFHDDLKPNNYTFNLHFPDKKIGIS